MNSDNKSALILRPSLPSFITGVMKSEKTFSLPQPMKIEYEKALHLVNPYNGNKTQVSINSDGSLCRDSHIPNDRFKDPKFLGVSPHGMMMCSRKTLYMEILLKQEKKELTPIITEMESCNMSSDL